MTTQSDDQHPRSYGCTFACGNPYDVIVTMVSDASTEFLCIPCFIKTAADMLTAMTNHDDPTVKAAMAYAAEHPITQTPGPPGRKGKKNAPATANDLDIFAAYDAVTDTGDDSIEMT